MLLNAVAHSVASLGPNPAKRIAPGIIDDGSKPTVNIIHTYTHLLISLYIIVILQSSPQYKMHNPSMPKTLQTRNTPLQLSRVPSHRGVSAGDSLPAAAIGEPQTDLHLWFYIQM